MIKEIDDNLWLYFAQFAQEEMTSVEAKSTVSQISLEIFKQVQGMEGSHSNLLKLQQLLISVFNSKIHQEHKEELAGRIQKALQGKIFEPNATALLQSIQSHLIVHLTSKPVSSVSPKDLALTPLTLATSMEGTAPLAISTNASLKPSDYPNALQFSGGTVQIDEKLKKKLIEKSLYFRTMWQGGFKEQTEATLKLDSFKVEEFNFFLDCLEKKDIELQQACDLLSLGLVEYFQAPDLKDNCLLTIQKFVEKFDRFEKEDFDTLMSIYDNFKLIPGVASLMQQQMSNVKKLIQAFQKHDLKSFSQFLSNLPIEQLSFEGYKQVSDQELAFFAKITSLKEVDLTSCSKITGKGLATLPTSLEKLNLYDCRQLTDDDLTLFIRFNHSEVLDLFDCKQTTGKNPANLSTSLKKRKFYCCDQLSDDDLTPFNHLEELDLSKCKQIKSLATLPTSIKKLNLCECSEIDDIDLAHLVQLKELNLRGVSKITGKGLKTLPTSLKKLVLSLPDNFTDQDLANLSHLNQLEELNFDNCEQITGQGFTKMSQSLKKLYLNLCMQLTDETLIHLTTFNQLEELGLSRNMQITGQGFTKMPQSLKKLYLDLCVELADEALASLTTFNQLEELDIHMCGQITEKELSKLPVSLKKLKFEASEDTDDFSLAHLIHLEDLTIYGCYNITNQSLKTLPVSLKKLMLTKTKKIADSDVNELAFRLTQLKSLNIDRFNS